MFQDKEHLWVVIISNIYTQVIEMMNQSCLNEVRQMERIFAMLEQFSFCTFRNQSWKRNWKSKKRQSRSGKASWWKTQQCPLITRNNRSSRQNRTSDQRQRMSKKRPSRNPTAARPFSVIVTDNRSLINIAGCPSVCVQLTSREPFAFSDAADAACTGRRCPRGQMTS